MKKITILICCLIALKISAQEKKKAFDFIITIDNNVIKSVYSPQIIVKKDNIIIQKFDVSYYPGSLTLFQEDLNLLPETENTLFLKFNCNVSSLNDRQELRTYEIDMGKNWFDLSYLIIKIYNIDKKENRKLKPLIGKNYTFELDYSGGQMLQIRK